MLFSILLLVASAILGIAQTSTFSPLRPPAIPLAVKSPYMSTWQRANGVDSLEGGGGYLAGQWPSFWAGQTTGWTGMIMVDNVTYVWMGDPGQNNTHVNQTGFSYTSTRSIFTMNVGSGVEMIVTFLSGITPDDLLRSSLPYSYMNVEIKSIDGNLHKVQLYTDITAEWVSGDREAIAQWDYGFTTSDESSNFRSSSQAYRSAAASNNLQSNLTPQSIGSSDLVEGTTSYHKVYRQQQLEFSEFNSTQQADWGYWYYATKNVSGLTYQSGDNATVRGTFMNTGALPNTEDTNYRPIDQSYPVFGFAIDLGEVNESSLSNLFQLSLHQNNCILFESGKDVNTSLPCMWTNYFKDDASALHFFYNDYDTASSLASDFDQRVEHDSVIAGGQDYASITSLAARQAFGAIEVANTPAQPLAFMKEISSDGNVNTVDVIFPFHPVAIYANATILKWLLDPLFINQEAGNWPNTYSIHDIGSSFPNATGHNDGKDEMQPLEECGNMLIMTLAYAQRANDNEYLTQHYDTLKQWTGYLVEEALIPASQISTDDFAGSAANQTNLAIKGIIGIEAMAQIANRTGNIADGQNYTNIARDYITQWQGYAISQDADPPHTTFNYNNASSFSLLYNLFSDAELGLQLVPQSVYDMQSKFYATRFATYGVPLDSRHTYTKADWELWCAAIADNSTKNQFTAAIAKWLGETPTTGAFTDLYDTIGGDYPQDHVFVARPVVGGVFSFLALNTAPKTGIFSPDSSAPLS